MKTLTQYINEMKEYKGDYSRAGYRLVVLARRTNIDCKNLTEKEFVDMMVEDFEEAYDVFRSNVKLPSREDIERWNEKEMERHIRYAEKKWKTEKRRAEYLDPIRFKISNHNNFMSMGRNGQIPLDFTWDIGNYEIPAKEQPQHITMSNHNFRDINLLKAMYKDCINNKWFQEAIGWEFVTSEKKDGGMTNGAGMPIGGALIVPLYSDELTAKEKERLKWELWNWEEHHNSRWYGQGRYMGD